MPPTTASPAVQSSGTVTDTHTTYGGETDFTSATCLITPYGIIVEQGMDSTLDQSATLKSYEPTNNDLFEYIVLGSRDVPFTPWKDPLAGPVTGDEFYGVHFEAQGFEASAPGSGDGEGFGGDMSLFSVTIQTSSNKKSGTIDIQGSGAAASDLVKWTCN